MAFVKLDCGILTSTLWVERDARDVFVTALLMAEPRELQEPAMQLECRSLEETGWTVPAGWYGFVAAAGVGIIRMACVDEKAGMDALERLGRPEPDSRSKTFDGRRLVRVDGGYVVLNYMRYRERDATAAERSKRWRDSKRSKPQRNTVASRSVRVATRNVTQAEVEVEVEAGREQRTTELRTATPPAAQNESLPAKPRVLTWNQLACEAVTRRYKGTAPGARITKALRPLVASHGESVVLEAWGRYLDETDADYLSPEKFATTFGKWSGSAPSKVRAQPSVAQANKATLDQWEMDVREGRR